MFGKRPDGRLATEVPAYRRIMPYIMRGANESAVYFELSCDVTETTRFVERYSAAHAESPVSVFHVVLWAAVRVLGERPRLNRFVAGGRLYQRDGIWITYSAKKRKSDDSPVVMLKKHFDPTHGFTRMVADLHGNLQEGRSAKKSRVDKELAGVLALPGPGVRALLRLGKAVDSLGLWPKSFIDGDPMYASLAVANLGSLEMDAGYHHLYEYGNIPIFCVIGQTRDRAVVRGAEIVSRPIMPLKFSYDERIEDGLYAQRALQLLQQYVEDPVGHGIDD